MDCTPLSRASALAGSVFPVPGDPASTIPVARRVPASTRRSGYWIGHKTVSVSSRLILMLAHVVLTNRGVGQYLPDRRRLNPLQRFQKVAPQRSRSPALVVRRDALEHEHHHRNTTMDRPGGVDDICPNTSWVSARMHLSAPPGRG
jgi:hypothetical protein